MPAMAASPAHCSKEPINDASTGAVKKAARAAEVTAKPLVLLLLFSAPMLLLL